MNGEPGVRPERSLFFLERSLASIVCGASGRHKPTIGFTPKGLRKMSAWDIETGRSHPVIVAAASGARVLIIIILSLQKNRSG